jgi:hypothetical protein
MTSDSDIIQAKAFLEARGIPLTHFPPHRFAGAAQQLNMSFSALLRFLGRLLNSGQGMGQAPIARGIAEEKARRF